VARPKRPAWKRAGYKTEYQYRKARKQAREWSTKYSRTNASAYRKNMSAQEVRDYLKVYSQRVPQGEGKTLRFRNAAWRRHTMKWLHEQDPETYPGPKNRGWWDDYFGI